MKRTIILLTILMVFSGCSDSDDKAQSTSPVGVNGNGNQQGTYPEQNPGRNTGTEPGVTPYSYGENRIFPLSDIQLGFDRATDNRVYSDGTINLQQQFGFAGCSLQVGTYTLQTSTPGVEKGTAHNYEGIIFSAAGPVSFTATLDNSLSIQNQNSEWVMHAVLTVTSVNGSTCTSPMQLSFGMPLAQ